MTKNKRKKKSPNFVAGHHVVHFYFLQNQDLFQDFFFFFQFRTPSSY